MVRAMNGVVMIFQITDRPFKLMFGSPNCDSNRNPVLILVTIAFKMSFALSIFTHLT